MRGLSIVLLASASFALSGCLAKTAFDVATAPVRAASKAVDLATTSQSEADEKRGREIRKREERLGELQREREKNEKACLSGSSQACDRLSAINAEIRILLPQVPVEPDDD
ncbi:hypothetical protein GCM10011515_24270 [Tsuneonella deserti]|uniref:Murein lipoprotein n=1 Tax=Tsuneonella deserti TaxID=2035528 RepID=A0ABQ1SAG3_9SPHN|nr:hypothetical protein [Tsuneonella deserti]GGE03787.1 hypothetical protein GCM10011515_24270 [Tsuneonella deserti]